MPLYIASQNGHLAGVQVLLENGAEVDKARAVKGATPLFVASVHGHVVGRCSLTPG